MTFTAREGSSLSANTIGNIFTIQEIFGYGLTPRLTEASYEQPLAHKKLNLEIGRLITGNDQFDRVSSTCGGQAETRPFGMRWYLISQLR